MAEVIEITGEGCDLELEPSPPWQPESLTAFGNSPLHRNAISNSPAELLPEDPSSAAGC